MNLLLWIGLGILVLLGLGVAVFFLTVRQAAETESQDLGAATATATSAPQSLTLEADIAYEIRQLMDTGKKTAAIKRVRAATNWDLQTARAYVENLEAVSASMPFAHPVQPVVPAPYAPSDAATLSSAALEEVQTLLAQNQKIAAIKKMRAITGWGLKEAQEYVEAMPLLGQTPPMPPLAYQSTVNVDIANMDAAIRNLLAQNKKINAVKLVREATGWGLKESKEHVDAIQRQGF